MSFGKKKEEAAKKIQFYLKVSKFGGYFGKIGDEEATVEKLPTGGAKITMTASGETYTGKTKEGQYGPFEIFIIDGRLWFGSTTTHAEWGEKYKLSQGPVADMSDDWKAKKEGKEAAASFLTPEEGGEGPAGLAAPKGAAAGVAIKTASVEAPRPPKPRGYGNKA